MPPRKDAGREIAVAAPAAAAVDSNSNEGGSRTDRAARRAAFIQCLMYKPVIKKSDARQLMKDIFGPGKLMEPCTCLKPS